jgi:hypothetical protein
MDQDQAIRQIKSLKAEIKDPDSSEIQIAHAQAVLRDLIRRVTTERHGR